jgi:hypothetical protein
VNEGDVADLIESLRHGLVARVALAEAVTGTEQGKVHELLRFAPGASNAPFGNLMRSDGSAIIFHMPDFLRAAVASAHQEDQLRASITGALVTVGDALASHKYFDRGPDLELLRHLRNGLAHGNRFNLRRGEPVRPAHFTGPDQRILPNRAGVTAAGAPTFFEVTHALDGQSVLFDFMGAGDVHDLLMFVGWRLRRIANGDPPEDLWPQR